MQPKTVFTLDETRKARYRMMVFLKMMQDTGEQPDIMLPQELQYLKKDIDAAEKADYLKLNSSHRYEIDTKGLELLQTLEHRSVDHVKMFEVFCAVDLKEGHFAFSDALEKGVSSDLWNNYLNLPRFEDLRVAVAQIKGLDVLDFIFTMMFSWGDFDFKNRDADWTFDLSMDKPFEEMLDKANKSFQWVQMHDDPEIAKSRMENVISKGVEVMINLAKQEEQIETERRNARLEEEQAMAANSFEQQPVYQQYESVYEEPVRYTETVRYYNTWQEPQYNGGPDFSNILMNALILDAIID